MSTRRGFLAGILGGAVVAISPGPVMAAVAAPSAGVTSVTVSVSEVVRTTLRKRMPELVRNLSTPSPFFQMLAARSRG